MPENKRRNLLQSIRWLKIDNRPPDDIADHYANILRDSHRKNKPGKNIKRKKEEELLYNKPFTD